MEQPGTLRTEIIAILRLEGPMTSAEIAKEIDRPYASVRRAISEARKGKIKAFYVTDYDEASAGSFKRPAIYAIGNKEDKPYPNIGMAQKYRRHWQREKAMRQIIDVGEGNHFASLIVQVTK